MADGPGAGPVLAALSRLLAATADGAADGIHAAILDEARACFGADAAVLLAQGPGRRLRVVAGDTPGALRDRDVALDDHPLLAGMLDRRVRVLRPDAARRRELAPLLDGAEPTLLLLLRAADRLDGVLVLAGAADREDDEVAEAFANAAAAALERLRTAEEHERQVRQQQALTRAAKALNESLDLETVLARICREAVTVTGADLATLYRSGGPDEPLVLAAAQGLPPEALGWRLPAGAGLAGKVMRQGRAMLTNDYPRIAGLPADAPLPEEEVASAIAAPLSWDGAPRGVIAVAHAGSRMVGDADLALLETFAELAAAACANASAHAGLAHVARTDGLTGCLNHAALHDGLAREIERALRGERPPLALILVDLDDFKQINEVHGHLVGDEVLRRAGHALRHAMRPYDLAARYGGDEFALVTVDADEGTAVDVAHRVLERLADAIEDLLPPGGTAGTAGVAEWSPDLSATDLIARADRALLYAKHEGHRGGAHAFSAVPAHFRPGRFAREDRRLPDPAPMPAVARDWPEARHDEQLRERTRRLALVNALGGRLSGLTTADAVLAAAADELRGTFGYAGAGAVGGRAAPGLVARCLRTRRPVLAADVAAEPDHAPAEGVAALLAVPLWASDELFGALWVTAPEAGAFGDGDVALLEAVAAQVGAAVHAALLVERLEDAWIGTTGALAAALEKDAYSPEHARSIAQQADAVARALGLGDDERRDVRLAAVLHDVGKVVVPEEILRKPGPLDADERAVVQRHAAAGAQILAPVRELAGVGTLVRHEHERWDGAGYPDGLAGEDIPLGSRIILACDALHAMTCDRPYRRALTLEGAVDELRRHAGTQFDPAVVDALVGVLAVEGAA